MAKHPDGIETDLVGTYKLLDTRLTFLDTGQTIPKDDTGFVMYGRDGRMMAMIQRVDRPKPASIDKATDQECLELFRSMIAYGGTYTFDGMTVEHHINISLNETWTGTAQIRDVKRDGSKLILSTRPAPSPFDGKMVSATLTWEKFREA
ncbi:lipocalin-like domain-containing protein [Bradyrhizobium sp. 17]|uniref:lipocalin-like domain-containing protein n=1 Tax=Bradyrhizobium sp. 17 TaxID=2782649 RepID=UPI001FF8B688|nr:lipocalin-like domain-containing protein [Bradyrhizobium sp. 17]MCK1522194.1 lipocalin-like domain-containing protein [Bradyrhizobium sp. 17]